jgi:2-keto-4-pentenoate hydratase/2-oxohepta-3-ene-1,7-dioic acid hydratase in catechol pathway
MKWMRFDHGNRWGLLGLLQGEEVLVHTGDLFDQPRPTGERLTTSGVTWRAPCEPRTMLALWNNFRALGEKNGWAVPAEPLYFAKAASSLAAHSQPIPAPAPEVGRVAYEGELAVVIGRPTWRVSAAEAAGHIFGYTCANDVTAIELLNRDPTFAQWTRAKSMPGFGVIGPVIETDFDIATARVRTLVGGRARQDYPLADMIFPPHELVSRISQDVALQPGDVILCGTSLGVLPMKPGTEVSVEIDGIGALVNTFG